MKKNTDLAASGMWSIPKDLLKLAVSVYGFIKGMGQGINGRVMVNES